MILILHYYSNEETKWFFTNFILLTFRSNKSRCWKCLSFLLQISYQSWKWKNDERNWNFLPQTQFVNNRNPSFSWRSQNPIQVSFKVKLFKHKRTMTMTKHFLTTWWRHTLCNRRCNDDDKRLGNKPETFFLRNHVRPARTSPSRRSRLRDWIARGYRRPSAALPARTEAEQRRPPPRAVAGQPAAVGGGSSGNRESVFVRAFGSRNVIRPPPSPSGICSGFDSVFQRSFQVRLLRSGQVPDEGDQKLRRSGETTIKTKQNKNISDQIDNVKKIMKKLNVWWIFLFY